MLRLIHALRILAVLALVALVPAGGAVARGAHDAGDTTVLGPPEARQALRYIVQLTDPPLAQYRGGISSLGATAVDAAGGVGRGRTHLDVAGPAATAYVSYLDRQQDRAIAALRRIAPDTRIDWRYHYTFNGFTATATPEEASALRRLPGVKAVHAEEWFEPEMDKSLEIVRAKAAWTMLGGPEEAGLGARVAIVDSGINKDHPFMNDSGMEAPEGFPAATLHLRDGRVLEYPAGLYTNNKVVAARIFVAPELAEGLTDEQLLAQRTPYGGGHGAHVAGTVAGRHGNYDVDLRQALVEGVETLELSGVAPMAQVFNYKASYAASPEYIAMLEQMVVDEIDAMNMSQGHIGWLLDHYETHPMAQAFEGAADAGVVVVMSAGNAGRNGPTSLSATFKYSPKVLAVGSSSNSVSSYMMNLKIAGDGAPAESYPVGGRGAAIFTQTITAPLVFVPDGGCAPTPAAQGAIAVVERFNADGTWIGTCGYTARAGFMKDSGAVAILYVYYDRDYGNLSRTALALPGISIGSIHGPALVAWLQGNPAGASGTIELEARRLPAEADILAGSSSRGPGYDWSLKPDITAPGNNILSSVTGALVSGGQPEPYFTQYSGTSMASPHVTGAAALVRSGHPDWTSAQVRSALINTSARAVKVRAADGSLRDAAPYESGPGRLDLANAIDPGAVLDPPKAGFGEVEFGDTANLMVTVSSVSDDVETWSVAVEPHGGDGVVTVDKDSFTLAAGEETTLSLSFDSSAVTEDEHFGDVILSRGDTGQALRLVYFAYVSIPENRKDVLVVDWSYGDTPDYTSYYTDALDELGLTYDVWHAGETDDGDDAVQAHPPFKTLQSYDLVILNTNESREPLIYTVAGAYQYQNYLLHGGNMLVAGQGDQDWWTIVGPNGSTIAISQNAGCEYCVPRYFAGFTFGLTATLSGKLLEYPEPVNKPEMEVVLAPHPEADGPFDYALDLSTGGMAKDGAAGNQYAFSSGSLVTGYIPTVEGAPPGVCTTAQGSNYCGDFDYAEVVFDHIVPYARPLWTYDGKVVGSYISGRHAPDEANIKWNAMFWGFGLEGVGKGGPDTVGRTELLGDVFSFLTGRLLTPPAVYLPWTAMEFDFGGGNQP